MKRFQRITYLVVLLLFLSQWAVLEHSNAQEPETWKIWEEKDQVPINKIWIITFNSDLDIHTVTSNNVYIEDENGNKADVKVLLSGKNKIIVQPPANNFLSNHTYTLYITKGVYDKKSRKLSSSIKMNFTTGSQKEKEIETFLPREDSQNIIEMSDNVVDLDLSNVIEKIEGNVVTISNTAAVNLQKGDIFFLPPTEDAPFGIAKRVVNIEDNGNQSVIETETPPINEVIKNLDISKTVAVDPTKFKLNPDLQSNNLGPVASTQKTIMANTREIEVITNTSTGELTIEFNQYFNSKIGGRLNGVLTIHQPQVNIDIETKKFLGVPYDFEFHHLEYVAKEDLDITLSASAKGEFNEKIPLGEIPVPLVGTKNLGLNLGLYLIVKSNGEIGFQYSFQQGLDMKIGIKDNPASEKLEPFSNPDMLTFENKGIELVANAKIEMGLETGVYILVGDIDLASLYIKATFVGDFTADIEEFINNKGEKEKKSCIYVSPIGLAAAEYSLGKEFKIQYFGKVDFKIEGNLFEYEEKIDPAFNCGFDRIQPEVEKEQLHPGEQTKLLIKAYVGDVFKSLQINDKNLEISTSTDDMKITYQDGNILVKTTETIEAGKYPIFIYYNDQEKSIDHQEYLYVEVLGEETSEGNNLPNDRPTDEEQLESDEEQLEPGEEQLEPGEEQLEPDEQPVKISEQFPDPNLAKAIAKLMYKRDVSETITKSEIKKNMENFYNPSLFLNNLAISSLVGIDIFEDTGLQTLSVQGNQLTSLDVSGLTSLQRLDVEGNQLTSLDVSGLTSLQELNVSNNQLTNLDVSGLTSLQYLYSLDNQLTSLDVSGLTSLQELFVSDKQLTSLDVSGLTSLQVLHVSDNQLTSLDVSGLTSLQTLAASRNQLTSLDMSALTSLQELYVSDNQLTSLDVSGLTSLQELYVTDNQLTSLDVSGLTGLQVLSAYNNQLTSLDVSGLTSLQELLVHRNQLTNLDVGDLISLTFLNVADNQLTSLDISKLKHLKTLYTNLSRDKIVGIDQERAFEDFNTDMPFK